VASSLYWTPNLAATFKQMHGYDIGKYTMLLSHGNGYSGTVYPAWIFSDAADRGHGYVADYRATLSYLLTTYYDHLVQWSNEYLGREFSGQTGYNLPVDMVKFPFKILLSPFGFPVNHDVIAGSCSLCGRTGR